MARTQAQSDRVDAIMAKVSGGEPKPKDYSDPQTRGLLMQTLNWYSYEKDRKDALAYVRAYLKKTDAKSVAKWDKIDANLFITTFGWIARMIMQGSTFDEATVKKLQDHVQTLMLAVEKEAEPEPEKTETVARKSIQEAMAEKQAEFLGEKIDGEIDNFVLNSYRPTGFDLYKYCQANNVAKQYMAGVEVICGRILAELALIGEDDQITEAYRHLGRRNIKAYQTFLENLIEEAGRYANFKKANRKPRVKKAKPAGEQVAKMKYLKEYADLNLKSVTAASIIGAQQLWVYNVKNKKLGVYNASGSSGFSVKGTSLQGYDPETSVQRTLRKPADIIGKMMTAGKVPLRRLLSDLSTTETPLNGRFNEDVMLLRVL